MFDFSSQKGVMQILAAIRTSDISVDKRGELRDLVFLYTNGGKDETVRIALEQKLVAYNIRPQTDQSGTTANQASDISVPAPEAAPPQPPRPVIGTFRSAPSFAVSAPSTPVVPQQPAVPHSTPPPPQQVIPQQPPIPAPVPDSITPDPAPVMIKVASVTPDMPEPVSPTPVPLEAAEPVVQAPAPSLASIPTMEQSQPASVDLLDAERALARIREIKASVNEKVGNPVNLVDIDNEVGREYMSALLDAMKRLNSGASPSSAMKRLEDAYALVLKTLETHQPTPHSISQPVPVVPQTPVPSYPVSPVVTPEPEPMFIPIVEQQPHNEAIDPEPYAESNAPSAPEPHSGFEDVSAPVPPSPIMQAPAPSVASQFSSLADLRDATILSKNTLPIEPQPKASPIESGDPLFAADVDDGLEQLLSEWSIFKRSGLFGTGPKGREHPLFKKMSSLQIPLILAGRFEGATQEIKQSVTDYMNGWRYEQGIVYEQNETFEHYLRRVIRHILDLQKA